MPRSRKAAAGGGGGGTGKTKAGGASKPKKRNRAVAGVGVDFSRVKRKVGRSLAPAANATDTTVTAKSITLPSQSVAENRKGVATTADRDLSLQELLSQLSHHSAKVRRDALLGIAELAGSFPGEVRRHSGGIAGGADAEGRSSGKNRGGASSSSSSSPLEALAERSADPDPEVRSALRGALSAVAAAVGPLGVTPFLPLLMAHARRAMGSPDPRTRADALSLAAEAMAATRGPTSKSSSNAPSSSSRFSSLVGPALAACAAQLNPAARARSLKAGSLKSLQASLKGVRAFLEAASERGGGGGGEEEEEEEEGEESEQGEDESEESEGASRLRPLYSFRCAWAPALAAPAAEGLNDDDDDDDDDDDGEGSDGDGEGGGGGGGNGTDTGRLLPTGVAPLLAALCSAWDDLCPKGLFSGGRSGPAATQGRSTTDADEDDDVERSLAACDLLACARLLLASSFSHASSSPAVAAAAVRAASPLGRAVGSVLPAPPPAGKGTARRDALDAAAELNVEASKFLRRLLLAAPSSSPCALFEGGGGRSSPLLLPPWTARLLGWCDAALATGDALPRSEGANNDEDEEGTKQQQQQQQQEKKKKKSNKGSSSSPSLLRPLPDAALAAVVSASERGLAAVGAAQRSAAHAASLSALASRSQPGSRARAVAVRAIARALSSAGENAVTEEAAASWVPLLPRVVWEEAAAAAKKRGRDGKGGEGGPTAAAAAAAAALSALHAAARRCAPERSREEGSVGGSSDSPLAAALRTVAPSLAPLVLVMPPTTTTTAAAATTAAATAAAAKTLPASPGALSRLPPRCALLFADVLEHLPCLIPAPLLRALVAAAASPSSPYPLEFGERALAAAARAVASAASAAATDANADDDENGEGEDKPKRISPEDARAWASALLFLFSGGGERVEVVESSKKKNKESETTCSPPSSSPSLLWQRHSRVVASATRALRVSSGNGVGAAVSLLSGGLLEASGVEKEKSEEDDDDEESEGRKGRAAAGALAALCAVSPSSDSASGPFPSRLLDSVPLLVAAYARGGGCSVKHAGMGAELALEALRRREEGGAGALSETLDLLLLSTSSSAPSSPIAIASSCALIGAIAGDSSLRASLLDAKAATAARGAVQRARDAAAKVGEKEEARSSSAAASADAALAAALGS